MSYISPKKQTEKLDYEQVCKEVQDFLERFDEFEKFSRENAKNIRIGGDNCSVCKKYYSQQNSTL